MAAAEATPAEARAPRERREAAARIKARNIAKSRGLVAAAAARIRRKLARLFAAVIETQHLCRHSHFNHHDRRARGRLNKTTRTSASSPSSRSTRASRGFDAQERHLTDAQDKVRSSEEDRTLQRELRELNAQVQEKEQEMETEAADLAALRAKHNSVKAKNESITEREQRETEQRENIRESYLEHLRATSEGLLQRVKVLRGLAPAPEGEDGAPADGGASGSNAAGGAPGSGDDHSGGTAIEKLTQIIGELEAAIDTLASQDDANAVLVVGFEQQVFACLTTLRGELLRHLGVAPEEAAALFAPAKKARLRNEEEEEAGRRVQMRPDEKEADDDGNEQVPRVKLVMRGLEFPSPSDGGAAAAAAD